jgi:lipooligosaccharide transport system permease protein
MTPASRATLGVDPPLRAVPAVVPSRRAWRIVERNAFAYRRLWPVFTAGLLEPLLFLLSIGVGVGALVGEVSLAGGRTVPFDAFVAPGLLAAAAMNGAVFDTTFNFFVKLKYLKTYDAILATPMRPRDVAVGEVAWALLRGTLYSAAFLGAMVAFGLVGSWWALLVLPVSLLIGAAFAAAGLAAATFLRSFVDFDLVQLVIVPMFLFSATFFPLEEYPDAVGSVVQLTPLYQGVHLCRSLVLGDVGWGLLVPVAYLVVMAAVSVVVAGRRLTRILTA